MTSVEKNPVKKNAPLFFADCDEVGAEKANNDLSRNEMVTMFSHHNTNSASYVVGDS